MANLDKFNPLPHFENLQEFKTWATTKVSHISAETFGWLAIIHSAILEPNKPATPVMIIFFITY